ncbi:Epoxide hydrolase 4 [Nowakowskiella sp. JEL0078]|nr:Epoxide hydrolase 4 [Nowakowskiella sp. JEL0078]
MGSRETTAFQSFPSTPIDFHNLYEFQPSLHHTVLSPRISTSATVDIKLPSKAARSHFLFAYLYNISSYSRRTLHIFFALWTFAKGWWFSNSGALVKHPGSAVNIPKEGFDFEDSRYGVHGFLKANSLTFHYVVKGRHRVTSLILLLHGYPECWYSWRHQLMELGEEFFVVAIDLRGYGTTTKPKGSHSYTRKKYVCDIRDIIKQLGYSTATIVGHDFGGIIAQAFAEDHPEMITNLILINTLNIHLLQRNMTFTQFLRLSHLFMYQLPWLPEYSVLKRESMWIYDLYSQLTRMVSLLDADYIRRSFRIPGVASAAMHAFRNLFTGDYNGVAATGWFGWTRLKTRSIKARTLVIWGLEDPIYSLDVCLGGLNNIVEVPITAPSLLKREIGESVKDQRNKGLSFVGLRAGHFVHQDEASFVNQAIRMFIIGQSWDNKRENQIEE